MMAAVNKVLPEGDPQDMIQTLLTQIRTSSSSGPTASGMATGPTSEATRQSVSSTGIPCTLPTAAAQSEQACNLVKQWLMANNNEDIKMHPAFSRFVKTMKQHVCSCPEMMLSCPAHGQSSSESLTLEDFFFHVASCVFDCVHELVPTVALGANMIHEVANQQAEQDIVIAFPDTIGFLMTAKEKLWLTDLQSPHRLVDRL